MITKEQFDAFMRAAQTQIERLRDDDPLLSCEVGTRWARIWLRRDVGVARARDPYCLVDLTGGPVRDQESQPGYIWACTSDGGPARHPRGSILDMDHGVWHLGASGPRAPIKPGAEPLPLFGRWAELNAGGAP